MPDRHFEKEIARFTAYDDQGNPHELVEVGQFLESSTTNPDEPTTTELMGSRLKTANGRGVNANPDGSYEILARTPIRVTRR